MKLKLFPDIKKHFPRTYQADDEVVHHHEDLEGPALNGGDVPLPPSGKWKKNTKDAQNMLANFFFDLKYLGSRFAAAR